MNRDLPVRRSCVECGMLCDPLEYHPYAACLMFKACGDSKVVHENLSAIIAYGKKSLSRKKASP